MFAVVETSGKQYQVQEGRYIDTELLDAEADTKLTLDKVVAIIAGEHSQIGQPYVDGATIQAKVLRHGKAKKVVSFKMRRKKGYRVKKGHRQEFTRILIENIEFPEKEETLKYVKSLEEETEKEIKQEEEQLQKAKAKKLEKKQKQATARKQAKEAKASTSKSKDMTKSKKAEPEAKKIEEQPEIAEPIEAVTPQEEVVSDSPESPESQEGTKE